MFMDQAASLASGFTAALGQSGGFKDEKCAAFAKNHAVPGEVKGPAGLAGIGVRAEHAGGFKLGQEH
jgi:hypothetical protein